MTTASHTMIARIDGHRRERQGLTVIAVCSICLVLAAAVQLLNLPPRALADTTHEIQ